MRSPGRWGSRDEQYVRSGRHRAVVRNRVGVRRKEIDRCTDGARRTALARRTAAVRRRAAVRGRGAGPGCRPADAGRRAERGRCTAWSAERSPGTARSCRAQRQLEREPDVEPHREPDAQPGMGERHVGHGAAFGPRVAPPADPGGGPTPLEGLLAAAVRGRADDTAARTQAVAAFRAARDGGAHTARTRRRDDWRPKEQGRPNRSPRAVFAVLLAGLTLGGVAVAAIGPISHDDAGQRDRAVARPSAGVPDRFPEAAAPAGPGAPGVFAPGGSVSRPPWGRDTEAHCRAYASVKGRGDALDARAWQRLVAAAAARTGSRRSAPNSWPRAPGRRVRGGRGARRRRRAWGSPGSRTGRRFRGARPRHRSREDQERAVGAERPRRAGPEGHRAGRNGLRRGGREGDGRVRRVAAGVPADGNGRGRHPPQERPRPSRGTGRAATRTLYSAVTAFCVTPRTVTA